VHEVSIAMSLVETISEQTAAERVDSVSAVHIRVGAFSGVVKDALLFAWDMAAEGSVASGARLVIEDVPLVVFCPQCDEAKTIQGHPILQCPKCQTLTPAIVSGRELDLVSIEVPDAVAAH